MLQCSNCGSNQDAGNFCGSCGGALVEMAPKDKEFQEEAIQKEQDVSRNESSEEEEPVQQAEQVPYQQALKETAATQVQTSTSSNDVVKQIVGVSKGFGEYFTEYIKGPSRIFSKRESEFRNGVISMSIISILIALSLAILFSNLTGPFREEYLYYAAMSSSSQSLPTFLSIFLNTLLLIVLAIIVTLTLLFVINKLFGTDYTYKEMVSVFGAHMVPVIVVGGISLLLVLVKSNTAGSIAVSITIAFSITTIPIYLISNLLSKRPQAVDPLYGYLLYVVSAGLSFAILFTIFIDSIIGNLFKTIQDL